MTAYNVVRNRVKPGREKDFEQAMRTIEDLLGARPEHRVPYILRPPGPGDIPACRAGMSLFFRVVR